MMTAQVATTVRIDSIGNRPSSRSRPATTAVNTTPARTARTTLRPVAAMSRCGKRESGSTESMTSRPRTSTTATFGRPSGLNVLSAYQATARPPNTQPRSALQPCRGGCTGGRSSRQAPRSDCLQHVPAGPWPQPSKVPRPLSAPALVDGALAPERSARALSGRRDEDSPCRRRGTRHQPMDSTSILYPPGMRSGTVTAARTSVRSGTVGRPPGRRVKKSRTGDRADVRRVSAVTGHGRRPQFIALIVRIRRAPRWEGDVMGQ
jgi:hypothetical protein